EVLDGIAMAVQEPLRLRADLPEARRGVLSRGGHPAARRRKPYGKDGGRMASEDAAISRGSVPQADCAVARCRGDELPIRREIEIEDGLVMPGEDQARSSAGRPHPDGAILSAGDQGAAIVAEGDSANPTLVSREHVKAAIRQRPSAQRSVRESCGDGGSIWSD